MKICLTALDRDLADAWERHCGDLDNVEIHHGSILDIDCDAVVSPANSFGFMDGGIDAYYSKVFGWHVQERLQKLIRQRHRGELLVGTAEIVPTDHPRIPYLIAAPTMRVPMILKDTVNPYLATRAVFQLIQYGHLAKGSRKGDAVNEVVRSVAFPGLGTGVGRVPPDVCAHQVRVAIDERLSGSHFPLSWSEAQARHQLLYRSSVRDLQFDA